MVVVVVVVPSDDLESRRGESENYVCTTFQVFAELVMSERFGKVLELDKEKVAFLFRERRG